MGRATFPARLGDVMFDAIIERTRSYSAEIPEYAVETGFKISDAVLKSPMVMDVKVFISNTPVSWKNTLQGAGYTQGDSGNKYSNRLESTIKKLESMYFAGDLYNFVYCGKTYTNMAIQSITVPEVEDMLNAAEVDITLKKVIVAKSQTTFIEDDYDEGGISYEDAGEQQYNDIVLEEKKTDKNENTGLNFCLETLRKLEPIFINPADLLKSPSELNLPTSLPDISEDGITAYDVVKIIVDYIGYKSVISESANKKLKNTRIRSIKSDNSLAITIDTVIGEGTSYVIAGARGAGAQAKINVVHLTNSDVVYFITDQKMNVRKFNETTSTISTYVVNMKSAISLVRDVCNYVGGLSVASEGVSARKITINAV